MAHTTCFRSRTVVLGVATISEFQAKRTEYKNRHILQSIKTINVQFYENVRTIKHKSGVVRYDVIPHPRWRTAAILKIESVQQHSRGSSDLHQILQVDVEIGANVNF